MKRTEHDFDKKLVQKMIKYWVGKPGNPLSGKTFSEISWLGQKYGYDLKGLYNENRK